MGNKRVNHSELVSFLNDCVEYNDYCSFFCDALSTLFVECSEDEIDRHTVQELSGTEVIMNKGQRH
jgi:hypothetical protein